MGITATFSDPYFSGGTVANLVPSIYPVALDGRPYMLDTQPETFYVRWKIETIPLIRQQADQSKSPAEATLNPEGFWRRSADSFHHGAGQTYRDRDDARDDYRFRTSKGLDVWTRYQMSLLNDTAQKVSSANTNLKVISAGSYLYYCDGSTIKRTTDITPGSPTFTSITYAGGSVLDMCSDGYNIFATDGSNIYTGNTGSTTLTSTDTTDATICGYAKARFMCAKGNILYNIPTLGSATGVMTFTHPNAGFTWVGFGEGTGHIFAAGYAGDKSLVYRIAIKTDASTLDPPIVCGELPDGEIVRAVSGYLNFVFLGTDLGVRMCSVDGQGNLTIGPLIATNSAVQAFEPQGRFMWFGYSNYDVTSTGLGRIDLTQFTDTLTPAYASDLMVTGTGTINSIASFQSRRVFAVAGLGIYAEASTLVTSGQMTTGLIGFGLPDPKTAIFLHVNTAPLVGSYTVDLSGSNQVFTQVGSEAVAGTLTDNFPANNLVDERFEVRINLTQGSSTTGPTFLRWTLKAIPSTSDGPAELYHIPIMMYPMVNIKGTVYPFDVDYERAYISNLRSTRKIVTYQQFNVSYTGIVVDFEEYPYGLTENRSTGAWDMKSTLLVKFQRLS